MNKMRRWTGVFYIALFVAVMVFISGCTLSGSKGIDDTPPVGADTGGAGTDAGGAGTLPTSTFTPLPPLVTSTPTPGEAAQLSDLEVLGTQAVFTATAQALGVTAGDTTGGDTAGAGDTTGGDTAGAGDTTGGDTGASAFTTPGAIITSDFGGQILPPTNTPFGTPAGVGVADTTTTTSCPPTHTVAAGENMFRIALKYGTTYQQLAAANGISNPDQLSVGQVLTIPGCSGGTTTAITTTDGTETPEASAAATSGPTTHVVQPGENLFRIALLYNTTYAALAAANGIANPNFLVVGQVLIIP